MSQLLTTRGFVRPVLPAVLAGILLLGFVVTPALSANASDPTPSPSGTEEVGVGDLTIPTTTPEPTGVSELPAPSNLEVPSDTGTSTPTDVKSQDPANPAAPAPALTHGGVPEQPLTKAFTAVPPEAATTRAVDSDPVDPDAPRGTLDATWTGTSPATQLSGSTFNYNLAMSCSGVTGAVCPLGKITIPFPEAFSIKDRGNGWWSEDEILAHRDYSFARDEMNGWWTRDFTHGLVAGESTIVVVSFAASSGWVPNNTTWASQPTLWWDGGSKTLESVTNTVTATSTPSVTIHGNATALAGTDMYYTIQGRTEALYALGQLYLESAKGEFFLPKEAEFVSFQEWGVPGVYHPETHSVTWEQDCVPEGAYCKPHSQSDVRLVVHWPTSVQEGVKTSSATFSAKPLGESTEVSARTSHSTSIVQKPPVGQLKWASGNRGGGLNVVSNWTSPSRSGVFGVTEFGLNTTSSTLAAVDWEVVDSIPCLSGGISSNSKIFSSVARDSLCSAPVYDVTTIKWSHPNSNTKVPVIKITYSDGTTALHESTFGLPERSNPRPAVDGDRQGFAQVSREGVFVARVEVSGINPKASSATSITILGNASAEAREWASGDLIRNYGFGRARFNSPENNTVWSDWGSGYAQLFVSVGGTSVAFNQTNPATQTYTLSASKTTPLSTLRGVQFREDFSEGSTFKPGTLDMTFVLPSGLPPVDESGQPLVDPEQDGSYRVLNLETTNRIYPYIDLGTPGVWMVDTYVGFWGQAAFMVSGSPISKCGFPQSNGWLGGINFSGWTSWGGEYVLDKTGIMGGTPEVPVPMCKVSYQVVIKGTVPGFALTTYVQGDNDAARVPSPGSAQISNDGTGTAKFSWDFANVGSSNFTAATLYAMLPRVGDTGVILVDEARGSTFQPTLTVAPAPVPGYTWWYSTDDNPCRPEVLANNPGCVEGWSKVAPTDLSTVKGLKAVLTAGSSVAVGTKTTFSIQVTAPAFDVDTDVAWLTVAASATAATGGNPLPAEAPKVGIGKVLVEKPVTPLAPSLVPAETCGVEGAVSIPQVEGVIYDQARQGGTVTVTATAAEGFVLEEGVTALWELVIPAVVACPEVVTPVAPELVPPEECGVPGSILIHETKGVIYATTNVESVYTVTATAAEGFVLAEGAVTSWEITIPETIPCDVPVTPAAPLLLPPESCDLPGSISIVETEGVTYSFTNEGRTYTIAAEANPGYVLADGAASEWVLTVEEAASCPLPPTDAVVLPIGPELDPSDVCGVGGTVSLPQTRGVLYSQTREGQTVTVVATAVTGYSLEEGATTEWKITIPDVVDCPLTLETAEETPAPKAPLLPEANPYLPVTGSAGASTSVVVAAIFLALGVGLVFTSRRGARSKHRA